MDIDDVQIDRVYRFKYANSDRERAALVVSIDRGNEVAILFPEVTQGQPIVTGIAYPQELSAYTPEQHAELVRDNVIVRLYTERVNMLTRRCMNLA